MNWNTPERFWARVQKTDFCWIWTGVIHKVTGYGYLSYHRKHQGAHRVAYQIAIGPIPDGMSVLHQCDVRACVRPDHLFLGTQADNIEDMMDKNRGSFGERHWRAKLNEEAVRIIRSAYISRKNTGELARRFGVNRRHIVAIVRGERWNHLEACA